MIEVSFKLNKQEGYDELNKFTYADYKDAEVGDIVVVNTRYGYAVAKVMSVGINDTRFTVDRLAKVEKVIKSKKEIEEEAVAAQAKRELLNSLRREIILAKIESLGIEVPYSLTLEELEQVIKEFSWLM